MKIDDEVRVYYGEWFNRGKVVEITEAGRVRVDFLDWVPEYADAKLQVSYIFYREVWVAAPNSGITVSDFR